MEGEQNKTETATASPSSSSQPPVSTTDPASIIAIGRDPGSDDTKRDEKLTSVLAAHNLFPTGEDEAIRKEVIFKLQKLSQECCLEIAQSHGISFTEADIKNPYSEVDAGTSTDNADVNTNNENGDAQHPAQPPPPPPPTNSPIVDIAKSGIVFAKVVTSGSYPLGVYNSGSDIDVAAVCANHVTRDDFFTLMEQKLKDCEDAKNVHYIRDAFVPIIDVEFMGISIDLSFVRLKLLYIPEGLNLNDPRMVTYYGDKRDILPNGREKDERKDNANNANGSRVAEYLRSHIKNLESFRSALRFIKFWATRNHNKKICDIYFI